MPLSFFFFKQFISQLRECQPTSILHTNVRNHHQLITSLCPSVLTNPDKLKVCLPYQVQETFISLFTGSLNPHHKACLFLSSYRHNGPITCHSVPPEPPLQWKIRLWAYVKVNAESNYKYFSKEPKESCWDRLIGSHVNRGWVCFLSIHQN